MSVEVLPQRAEDHRVSGGPNRRRQPPRAWSSSSLCFWPYAERDSHCLVEPQSEQPWPIHVVESSRRESTTAFMGFPGVPTADDGRLARSWDGPHPDRDHFPHWATTGASESLRVATTQEPDHASCKRRHPELADDLPLEELQAPKGERAGTRSSPRSGPRSTSRTPRRRPNRAHHRRVHDQIGTLTEQECGGARQREAGCDEVGQDAPTSIAATATRPRGRTGPCREGRALRRPRARLTVRRCRATPGSHGVRSGRASPHVPDEPVGHEDGSA